MKISIVVTYCPIDREEINLLMGCVKSLLQTDYEIEIIIQTAVKQSYAKTLNSGFKKATGDYIFVSNNDILAPSFYAERMIETIEKTDCMAVCAVESEQAKIEMAKEPIEDVKRLFGSFWAMPQKTLKKIGVYDERFDPFLFEDSDYWWRIIKAKGKILVDERVEVWHKKASSTTKMAKEKYEAIYNTNRQRFIDKWGDDAIKIFH